MSLEEFKNRYEKYDSKVQTYMNILGVELESQYQEIPDIFLITLDMIAGNLVVMCNALDEIVKSGISDETKYHGDKKAPQLQAFNTSQNNISHLIKEFGWTPAAKSRIRENTDKQDIQKLLEDLTK